MFVVVKEVVREMVALVAGYLGPRRYLQVACGLALLLAVGRMGLGLVSLFGPGDAHGFSYQRVRGAVLYEDGGRIPLPGLSLRFLVAGDGARATASDTIGQAVVDERSGTFDCVVRVLPEQSDRSLKVVVALNSGAPAPSDVVPSAYADPSSTPLEVSPRGGTVALRVRKPSS